MTDSSTTFDCNCEGHNDINYFTIRKLPQRAVETEAGTTEIQPPPPCFEKWRQSPASIPTDSEEEEDKKVSMTFLKHLVDENKITVECHTPNCKHNHE